MSNTTHGGGKTPQQPAPKDNPGVKGKTELNDTQMAAVNGGVATPTTPPTDGGSVGLG